MPPAGTALVDWKVGVYEDRIKQSLREGATAVKDGE